MVSALDACSAGQPLDRASPQGVGRGAARPGSPQIAPSQGRHHGHLWSLPDGTGLHAPFGELVVEAGTGRVCCHLCGHWYVSLGGHLRAHGHTAESYRATMGLCRTRRLIAVDLSRSIAVRQARAYRRSPAVRARLAAGQELSRTGDLTRLASAARARGGSAERTRIRRAALEAGRATRAAEREQALARRLRELGIDNLTDYLHREYADGASLRGLARVTGLGWARLRRECEAAGITVRTAGATSGRHQRRRARLADEEAGRRVGTEDLSGWLLARRDDGWSLARIGAAVGHSAHWVRARCPELTGSPPATGPAQHDGWAAEAR